MKEKVVKSDVIKNEVLVSGIKLELVEVDLDKFEIRINGETGATECDISRAHETFEDLVRYYS